MSLIRIPPPAVRRLGVPTLRSVALFQWQARRLSLHTISGTAGTLTRSGTATFLDAAGATVTAAHSMPRWEARAWFDVPSVGLRMTTDDLSWLADAPPRLSSFLVECIDVGTAGTNGAGLVYIGANDATGNRLVIRGTGTTYAVDLVTGGGTSTATLAAPVASGQAVQLAVQLDDDGTDQRVRIRGTVAGAAVAWSAWGTARTRAATWGTAARVRLNRVGSAGTQGSAWFRSLAWHPGQLDLHEMVGVL